MIAAICFFDIEPQCLHFADAAGNTRKILIYAINYAPEMIGVGRSTGEIGAYLDENGFDVCVVTTPPHYPGWRAFPPYSAWRYASETRAGVKICAVRCCFATKCMGFGASSRRSALP